MEKFVLELITNFEKFFFPSHIKNINLIFFLINIFFGINLIKLDNGIFGIFKTMILAGITWILLSPFIAIIERELILVLLNYI